MRTIINRLAPLILAAPILIQLYHDLNLDGQRQSTEPPAAQQSYSLRWTDGQHTLSSTGQTDADGTVQATDYVTGTWTLRSDCINYTFIVTGDVAGQAVVNLSTCPHLLYLPVLAKDK